MSIIGFVKKQLPMLTEEQAHDLCECISVEAKSAPGAVRHLAAAWPEFKWRWIFCHDLEFTYAAITIKDPDPRELEEMSKHGKWNADGEYRLFPRAKKKRSRSK